MISPTALNWYRGNTHTHTAAFEGSDADGSLDDVATWYRDHGYDFLFITDHDRLTEVGSPDSGFLLLPGEEVGLLVARPGTDDLLHVHLNGLDITRLVVATTIPAEERAEKMAALADRFPEVKGKSVLELPSDLLAAYVPAMMSAIAVRGMSIADAYSRTVDDIRSAGGLAQVNHPNFQLLVTAADLLPIEGTYLMEVWNSYPSSNNLGGIDANGERVVSTEELWDELLSSGRVVWGTASDDAHAYFSFDDRESPTPGKGWIVVRAPELSRPAVLDAIGHGRFYASTGIVLDDHRVDETGISLDIRLRTDWSPFAPVVTRYLTRFIGTGGEVLAEVPGRNPVYRYRGDETYVRASITDSDGRRAWIQPVFFDGR